MDEESVLTKKTSFVEHYQELRYRLLWFLAFFVIFFFVAFFIKDGILNFILGPYRFVAYYKDLKIAELQLQAIAVWETFLTKIRLCLFSAFIFSTPFGFYHLYRFIAPALYQKERRIFFQFLCFAPLLFLLGAAFIYFCVAPLILWLSLTQEKLATGDMTISLNLTISNYLDFILYFILIFGMIFQLPLFAVLLQKIGWLKTDFLQKNRRWAILISAIFAAIITPPDLFTMLGVLIPLILLYEVAIWLLKLNDKKITYKI